MRFSRWRWSAAMVAAYLWVTPINSRYLLAIVPVVGLIAVFSIGELWPRLWESRRSLAAWAVILTLPGWLYAWVLLARRGPVPLDDTAREAFLGRQLECYSAVRYLDRTFGDRYKAYGLFLERLMGVA